MRAAAFRARLVEEKKARAAETAAILATLLAVLPEDAKPANQGVAEVVAAVAELVGELQAQVEEHEGCEERQQKLEAELEEEVATGEREFRRLFVITIILANVMIRSRW